MKAIKINENMYWVGGIDWDLRNFHGYLTQKGSTYNAYLIIDDKITLIDTVKHYLFDEMLARISSVIDPTDIDYIVANHVEMDHSGSLPKIMEIATDATVITSPNGKKGLTAHYKKELDYKVVKTGDSVAIGERTLNFVLTPMVHWPDNMVTYCADDKILFSNDAFGQHLSTSERFDDEYSLDIIMKEAKKYYANIVLPYGLQVQKALEQLGDLAIDVIAPSHGIVWRSHIPEIVEKYKKWSKNETDEKAIIIYDTMWGSTEKIAYAIQDAFEEMDIHTSMRNLQSNHISDIMTEILTAEFICVGSPTLNNNMMPSVSSFLTYLKGLSPKDRVGLAFGSYGWGGQSIGLVEKELEECGFELLDKIRIKYIPDETELNEVKENIKEQI